MAAAQARRLPTGTVTLLFTDIEGSTALLHAIGDRYGEVLGEHHALLRGAWAAHGGIEVNTEGDAFFVAFPSPTAAVRAALEAQLTLGAHRWSHGARVRVRMGVHTGQPKQRDGAYWGIDVHYAARLCAAAHGDQVLLSAATRALVPEAIVDDLGEHGVKDFPTPRTIYHLVVAGRHISEFPHPRTLEVTRSNLPSIGTPLVGRERELAELRTLLIESPARLVTVVGLGGSGKTRVALGCGGELIGSFPDGVFLVALAPVPAASGVAAAVAEAVGAPRRAELSPEAAIIEHLRTRRLLLVIDNVEHVLDAAPLLGRVLEAAAGVRMLVTSHAPLRLAAETVLPLDALMVPGPGDTDVAAIAEFASVALFLERARAGDPSFALTEANAQAVAELCRRLEGLPLALELAAARVRLAGPQGLLAALTRGIDALGGGARDLPGRLRSLRAALDWTLSLLRDEERLLFVGLGTFADAWTVEQAEAIFGQQVETWDSMAALMDFSLIRRRGDGRLTMGERVRAHARELLAASAREHDLRRRHAELMADTAETLSAELLTDVDGAIARAHDEVEEFDLALAWSAAADGVLHRRLVAALGRPFYFLGRLPSLADAITTLAAADDRSDAISGRLLVSRAMVSLAARDAGEAARWTGAAVVCHRELGTREDLLMTMALHGHMLTSAERPAEARACLTEALGLAANHPDSRLRDQLQGTFAFAAVADGAFEEAEALIETMLARPERTDFAANAALSYWADCALGRGDYKAALERYILMLRRLPDVEVYSALLQLTGVAAALAGIGREAEAAELLGSLDRASSELGVDEAAAPPWNLPQALCASAARRLGAPEWETWRERGQKRDFAETMDWALGLVAPSAGGVPALAKTENSRPIAASNLEAGPTHDPTGR